MPELVTVGIDDSPESRAAVQWAADEARRRGRPLRLLHAWGITTGMEPIAGDPADERRHSEHLLQQAETDVGASHPDLTTETVSVPDGPVHALLSVAVRSEVLVLGSRGLGVVAGFLLGSVSQQVLARATCPVVLVRSQDTAAGAAGQPGREVVLGLKRPGDLDRSVVHHAFSAAALRGLPLRVVHAWRPPVAVGGYPPVPSIEAEVRAAEEEGLTNALDSWRTAYPDVDVIEQPVIGSAAQVLVEAAAGASLLVVGRGGRRLSGLGLRVGPVVHAALHHAPCPVAVVPHG
ncbi:universal stress protein [Streptomyces sodiiphilus]|uniref:Universal stress protein n=1 Tax=Streptomyces sodiiphilus TaxID=226217 RepID=A0ABN2P5F9_9ACTN